MTSYSPENDIPASPGELGELYRAWAPWLLGTGQSTAAEEEPLVYLPQLTGDLLDPDLVPMTSSPLTHRRTFIDTGDIHLFVPSAASVLGLGKGIYFAHHGAYISLDGPNAEPGDYHPADVFVGIPSPPCDGLSLRAYRITLPRGGSVNGSRHDKDAATSEFARVAETGMAPRITRTECRVLGEVGQACMLLYGSETVRPQDV